MGGMGNGMGMGSLITFFSYLFVYLSVLFCAVCDVSLSPRPWFKPGRVVFDG